MKPRNVLTIFRKDVLDAIRDARVLIALIVPFGVAIFYNFAFDDEQPLPEGTVAYTEVGSELPQRLQSSLEGVIRIKIEPYETADEVREVVAERDASVGLIIPEGFDESAAAGETPEMHIVLSESPGVTASVVSRIIDDVVRSAAGQDPIAIIATETVTANGNSGPNLFDDLGLRRYFILASLMVLIGMISMLAVPIILAEEAEKKTLEALTLIASYVDVTLAKALVGFAYITIGTGLLLTLTQVWPADPLVFFSGIALVGFALVGLGLLIGGLFRSANQLNTWGGLFLLPIIAPAFIVGMWGPGVLHYLIEAVPVAQGMKLAVNGMSGDEIFDNIWISYLVLAAWIAGTFSALVFRLSRMRT